MDHRESIAKYWSESGLMPNVKFNKPACFACGKKSSKSWAYSDLQVAHLIARAQGGSLKRSNLVLLCGRCHVEAPMIGTTRQPMIDWINRRESEVSRHFRRFRFECDDIDPAMIPALVQIESGEMERLFERKFIELKVAGQSGSDYLSSCAAILKSIYDDLKNVPRETNHVPQI